MLNNLFLVYSTFNSFSQLSMLGLRAVVKERKENLGPHYTNSKAYFVLADIKKLKTLVRKYTTMFI